MVNSVVTKIRGVSIVEILIVLGMAAVILAFFAGSFSQASNRSDLLVAVEGLNLSIEKARNTARLLETDVTLHLHAGEQESQHSIDFSFPDRNEALDSSNLLQDFVFPTDIRLLSETSEIRFDHRGLIDAPVDLVLISQLDESMKQSVIVQ